jgi:hypothetical protein
MQMMVLLRCSCLVVAVNLAHIHTLGKRQIGKQGRGSMLLVLPMFYQTQVRDFGIV